MYWLNWLSRSGLSAVPVVGLAGRIALNTKLRDAVVEVGGRPMSKVKI